MARPCPACEVIASNGGAAMTPMSAFSMGVALMASYTMRDVVDMMCQAHRGMYVGSLARSTERLTTKRMA